MSLVKDLDIFKQYENSLGNKYLAVMQIANDARQLQKKYGNVPLESEAITWILRGVDQKTLDTIKRIQSRKKFYLSYLDEVLTYVDDLEVKQSVKQSIKQSKRAQNLVYFYSTQDRFKQTRIRVLTRIIWYELFLDK